MASGQSTTASFYLSALFRSGTVAGLSDGELLERFASRRRDDDETAGLAFATLVARHGPMVLRVCRAALGDRHEAEDAFQATFLVLATRANAIRRGDSVAQWLYGVALRVAARARSSAARRNRHERRRAEMTMRDTEADSGSSILDDDCDRILHEEIGRLPARFRSAVVLCYLEGLTHEMAADQLGCPVGTIRSRLATARDRLRRRLTHRGVAPTLIQVSESAALSSSVPVSLAEITVRGALRVGLGKTALAGIISTDAISLMEGMLKTMVTTKLALLTTTVLGVGIVCTGAGMAAYSALGQDEGVKAGPNSAHAALQKSDTSSPAAESSKPQVAPGAIVAEKVKQNMLRQSQEDLQAILRKYKSDWVAYYEEAKVAQAGKTAEEAGKVWRTHRPPAPAFYAGALLQLAERDTGTAPAEEALIWIVTNLSYGSMPERAKEMITRDHIQSDKIEPLFNEGQVHMPASRATERLFREALAKSPHRKIQGLACYYLARYLDYQASSVHYEMLLDRPQGESFGSQLEYAGWGRDFHSRLKNMDAKALASEAEQLYERAGKEFSDLKLPHPQKTITADFGLPAPPTNFGGAARYYLHELKDLGIGRQAPEIEGTDLDGRPMKLSDYRGRVTGIYFCMLNQLRAEDTGRAILMTELVRGVAEKHANDGFAVVGVATIVPDRVGVRTVVPGKKADREFFKSALKTSGLPARFWWDIGQDGKPGPIQTAWNARVGCYVLDHRGVIRYKHIYPPEFEKAVATLLKEQKDELAKKKEAN